MNINASFSLPTISECKDISEKIDLYEQYGLYIKPIARLNITIQLPPTKNPGQAVLHSEIIDKLKKQSLPEEFIYLRIIKATLEFIRLEGELENKSSFKTLLSKLDNCTIKMNSYTDVLKVRAAEAKISYPIRHDWETFFKDSDHSLSNENEIHLMKPGERPDTIHIMDIPCKWFAEKKSYLGVDASSIKPSEAVLREVFSIFGELRMVDIPVLSNPLGAVSLKKPYSSVDLISGHGLINPSLNLPVFEAFIQYKDYISFVKAMDTFRGMKLLFIEDAKSAFTANIRVDFDRTKHLSDKEIKKREIDKLKAIEVEKIKNAQLEKEKEKETKQKEIANFRNLLEESMGGKGEKKEEKTKEQRRREREEIRRQKRLTKKQQEEEKKLEQRIKLEERKILIAQRKLESMRLLEELFNRVKVGVAQEELEKHKKQMDEAKRRKEIEDANEENAKRQKRQQEEQELKEKVEANLAKARELENKEEPEEFELRKDTLPVKNEMVNASNSSKTYSPDTINSPSSATQASAAKPRAVLLSNVQLQQQTNTRLPKLYDEEDNLGGNGSIPSEPSSQGQVEANEQSKDSSSGQSRKSLNENDEEEDSDGIIESSKNDSNNSVNTNDSLSNGEHDENEKSND